MVSDATLNRFFAFHVIAIPLVLLGLVAAHMMALHEVGSNNPDGIEIKKQPKDPQTGLPLDGISFHPVLHGQGHRRRGGVPGVFSVIMFFMPEMGGYFLEYNNFIPADPLKTPAHIAPVWYFTPYYSILRAVPSYVQLAVPGRAGDGRGGADLLPAAVARPRPGEVDPLRARSYKAWLAVFVVSFLVLGYFGVVPTNVWGQFPETGRSSAARTRATVAARL